MHRRLLSEPGWVGIPQKNEKTILRHSHRKWKSPVRIVCCERVKGGKEGMERGERERGEGGG